MEETESEKIAQIQAEASVEIAQIQADAEVKRAGESAAAAEAIAETQAEAEKETATEAGAALAEAVSVQNEQESIHARVEAIATRLDSLDERIRRYEEERTDGHAEGNDHGTASRPPAEETEEYEAPAGLETPVTEEPTMIEESEPVKEARLPERPATTRRPDSHYTRMQRRHGLRYAQHYE